MKIRITVDFHDRCRRAIALHYGSEDLASKDLCVSYLESLITSHMGNLVYEMDGGDALRETLKRKP